MVKSVKLAYSSETVFALYQFFLPTLDCVCRIWRSAARTQGRQLQAVRSMQ